MSSNNSVAAVAGSSRGGLSPPMPPPLPPPPVASTSSASDPKESKEKDKDKEKKPSLLNQKMQKSIKLNENHLLFLSERAINDSQMEGWLWKKSTSGEKWKVRFFVLYQNLLFYYENKEKTERPLGMIFLEGSYVERVIYSDVTLLPPTPEKTKEKDNKDKDKFEKVEKDHIDRNFCFQINYGREFVRRFEFCGVDDTETILWVYEIERASFSKQHLEMQKVTAKHLHIIQVVEVERTAKWHFSVNCEDLCSEIKFLKEELVAIKRERRVDKFPNTMFHTCMNVEETSCLCCLYESLQDDEEKLTKLRKVQSFLRGWLCRRKWKHIVDKYIKSPHADRLRKRNNVVFQLVEAEEEYIQQMEVLVTCFLRPFKMAASSKKPPCTHDDVNSIFLNSETVFFLHQIFLKGLTARLENWPTLVLGDLFSMLLPMLNIYQEYVRNHHYSLQVLTECKQHIGFAATLKRLESKPICNGRSLETFLTYPMHQIPRYIVTLHELLAYTPFEHVERKSLETAQVHLEQLSKQMHDEVSATENLRKNLSIERMIVDGCDILLDVKQIFIRQGTLVQVPPSPDKKKEKVSFKNLRASYHLHHRKEKEFARQCFLFSYHLIVTRRGNDGNLHLLDNFGKIPMSDSILIEDPSEDNGFERGFNSASSEQNNVSYQGRDFKLIIACKTLDIPLVIHFVAPTVNDKAAWISDLAACIDNAQFSEFCKPVFAEKSSINLPQYMRNDPRLFLDEPDIRFSKTLNSCKIPQIRYATADKLMERLTDLRFISIEFLNTFLLTYKLFTDGNVVLIALKNVYYTSVEEEKQRRALDDEEIKEENCLKIYGDYRRRGSFLPFPLRRASGASSVSGYCSEVNSERDRSYSYDSQGQKLYKSVLVAKYEDEPGVVPGPSTSRAGTSNSFLLVAPDKLRSASKSIFIKVNSVEETREEILEEESSDESQEADNNIQQADVDSSSNNSESVTDPGLDPCGNCGQEIPVEKLTVEQRRRHNISEEKKMEKRKSAERRKSEGARQSEEASNKEPPRRKSDIISGERKKITISEAPAKLAIIEKERNIRKPLKDTIKLFVDRKRSSSADAGAIVRIVEERRKSGEGEQQRSKKNFFRNLSSPRPEKKILKEKSLFVESVQVQAAPEDRPSTSSTNNNNNGSVELEERIENRAAEARQSIASVQASSQVILGFFQNFYQRAQKDTEKLPPLPIPRETSHRSSLQHEPNLKHEPTSQAGVVIGGIKIAKRRSSNSYASAAFAIATSAADNPIQFNYTKCVQSNEKHMEQIICTAATMRVLNVLRHWISKQGKDFQIDKELKKQTKEFLNEIMCYPHHTSVEHKSAAQLLLLLERQFEQEIPLVDLVELLRPPFEPSRESIITLSALEIAEQLTYIDHQIFKQITPEELMGNAWMKADKEIRAPHIVMMTKRFNDVSRLIASEIIKKPDLQTRAETIEKWAAVADIVRCLHNFNGVLQICSAFTNAAVFRLKNTWDVVSKTTKQSIEKHQQIVSSDGRFRALRDAVHKSDPPCIPYLGVYLTDLSFIEEGTPNFVEDNLINFSKMRMVAHIIREIRQYQHTTYKIDLLTRVSNYLLDGSILMDEEELYSESLKIEPRQARLQSQSSIAGSSTTPW